MILAESNADAAITGSSDLPPPGVTAAKMSVTSLASPEAIARTMAAIWAWWVRRGRGGDDKQRGSSGVAGRVSVFFEAL